MILDVESLRWCDPFGYSLQSEFDWFRCDTGRFLRDSNLNETYVTRSLFVAWVVSLVPFLPKNAASGLDAGLAWPATVVALLAEACRALTSWWFSHNAVIYWHGCVQGGMVWHGCFSEIFELLLVSNCVHYFCLEKRGDRVREVVITEHSFLCRWRLWRLWSIYSSAFDSSLQARLSCSHPKCRVPANWSGSTYPTLYNESFSSEELFNCLCNDIRDSASCFWLAVRFYQW